MTEYTETCIRVANKRAKMRFSMTFNTDIDVQNHSISSHSIFTHLYGVIHEMMPKCY